MWCCYWFRGNYCKNVNISKAYIHLLSYYSDTEDTSDASTEVTYVPFLQKMLTFTKSPPPVVTKENTGGTFYFSFVLIALMK